MLGPEDHEALIREDAQNVGDTSSTVSYDIARLTEEMRTGSFANHDAVTNMEQAQLLMRAMGFAVLGRLGQLKVEEAAILTDRLEAVDPAKQPLAADLHSLSFILEDERLTAAEPARQHELDGLAALSRAAGLVAIVHTHTVIRAAKPAFVEQLKADAHANVTAAIPKVSAEAQAALGVVLQEMDAGVLQRA